MLNTHTKTRGFKLDNIEYVKALYDYKNIGISGVIIGKAIYEKKFDITNLVKLSGN